MRGEGFVAEGEGLDIGEEDGVLGGFGGFCGGYDDLRGEDEDGEEEGWDAHFGGLDVVRYGMVSLYCCWTRGCRF